MTQFSYDHRKLDARLTKIRKNADELAKMLALLSSPFIGSSKIKIS